ncbi:hypothetical protein LSH36_510g00009 [Paralvinella palmiformis]|uniref:Uncharacterized protein n=1 Tax=Paralvinella palmiformis TaxID=53620 RepID=A0AAD9J9J4_9ANNE|nr:hypothetical protein LSH36_510g00009 [Paralvinella palmiformis]
MFLPSHTVYMEESTESWVSYSQEEDVKLFCGMLDGLTFLPEEDVAEGMIYLWENIPDGFEPLLQYFDSTCFSGSYRQIQPPQRPDGTIPPIHICPCLHHLYRMCTPSHLKVVPEQTIPMAAIRGMTYQTLIKLTANIESPKHRRSLDSKLGHAEHLLAVKIDDVECFLSLVRQHIGGTLNLLKF